MYYTVYFMLYLLYKLFLHEYYVASQLVSSMCQSARFHAPSVAASCSRRIPVDMSARPVKDRDLLLLGSAQAVLMEVACW